jgi:hypothetical protein
MDLLPVFESGVFCFRFCRQNALYIESELVNEGVLSALEFTAIASDSHLHKARPVFSSIFRSKIKREAWKTVSA